jgi:hypothetical protein
MATAGLGKVLDKLEAILDRHPGKVGLLCVNLDTKADEARDFLTRNRAVGQHVHQPGGLDSKAATKYGVLALPHLFLIGPDGKCVSKGTQLGTVEEEIKKLLRD